jgi:hypothetical protein
MSTDLVGADQAFQKLSLDHGTEQSSQSPLMELQEELVREIFKCLHPKDWLQTDCCCTFLKSIGMIHWLERYHEISSTRSDIEMDIRRPGSLTDGLKKEPIKQKQVLEISRVNLITQVCRYTKACDYACQMETLAPMHGRSAGENPCLRCTEYPSYLDPEPIARPHKYRFFMRVRDQKQGLILYQGFSLVHKMSTNSTMNQICIEMEHDNNPYMAPPCCWPAMETFLEYVSRSWSELTAPDTPPPNDRDEWKSAICNLTENLSITVVSMLVPIATTNPDAEEFSLVVVAHRPSQHSSRSVFHHNADHSAIDISMEPELVASHMTLFIRDQPVLHRLSLRIQMTDAGAVFRGIVVRSNRSYLL